MSGGAWAYKQYEIEEQAETVAKLLKAVAQTEHIVDWAVSGDTARRRDDGSGAERELFDLWVNTFNDIYGELPDGKW